MHPRISVLAVVLSVCAIVLALGAYGYIKFSERIPFAPRGTLLLSLVPKGAEEANLYTYDVVEGTLLRLGQDGSSNFDGSFSPDGERIAHIRFARGADASQVVVYDPATGERRPVSKGGGSKHSPDWSPVGSRLAFAAAEGRNLPKVYAADLPGAPRLLGDGGYPVWSLDGASVFALAQNGLVRYDFTSGALTKMWGADTRGMKLAASSDHSLVAWLIPGAGEVRLFKANPVNPRELMFHKALKLAAYDAVFSPDNVYAAFRVKSGTEKGVRSEVVIERLDTGERRVVLDLSPYEESSLFLSDWK